MCDERMVFGKRPSDYACLVLGDHMFNEILSRSYVSLFIDVVRASRQQHDILIQVNNIILIYIFK